MVNPYDIYTSALNTGYEVLQGLERAVQAKVGGQLCKPDYNEIAEFEEGMVVLDGADQDGDAKQAEVEQTDANDAAFDGTYIDVKNFSLSFKSALQDLDNFSDADLVHVHIGLYFEAEAQCNLVKFTRLSGSREAFIKIIGVLSSTAGEYLTGLDKKAWKAVQEKSHDERLEELYQRCFPQKKSGAKGGDGAEEVEAEAQAQAQEAR